MVYLNASITGNNYPDSITNLVANQSSELISSFGYEAKVLPHKTETSMKLFINQEYLARIVEGCNAVSVIILFVAFIISFAENFKKTFLFLFAGATLIFAVNIVRIAILAIAIYEYPKFTDTLHGVVFPAIIYSMIFLLWMIWVRMLPKTSL
jgi:exosortase family protein XrtF